MSRLQTTAISLLAVLTTVNLLVCLGIALYTWMVHPVALASVATLPPEELAAARPSSTPRPARDKTATAPATPTRRPTNTLVVVATPTPRPTRASTFQPWLKPTSTPTRRPTAIPQPTATHFLTIQEQPGSSSHPTLADFWDGRAQFVLEVQDTGLPMGESDTIVMSNGELWSYLHASARSAGAVDRCGDPVQFPGCTVIYRSANGGYTFQHEYPPVCQFECKQCPCSSERDHIDQQQYPRVAYNGQTLVLAYEYRGRVFLRRSSDGLTWSLPEELPASGVWKRCPQNSLPAERIGPHPFVPYEYACLSGGPPGLYVDGQRLYVLVGAGQNPGSLGCYYGAANLPASKLRKCKHSPLLTGAADYGPLEEKGPQTNPYFDFRMISAAEVQKIGERYYLLYEGIRGPGPGDPGDTQFGLGLARSLTDQMDGPWEKFPGNPILVDQPGNIGLGHADLVVINGQTVLYTSLNGWTRSRLALAWK